jgi:hypothetical protein
MGVWGGGSAWVLLFQAEVLKLGRDKVSPRADRCVVTGVCLCVGNPNLPCARASMRCVP